MFWFPASVDLIEPLHSIYRLSRLITSLEDYLDGQAKAGSKGFFRLVKVKILSTFLETDENLRAFTNINTPEMILDQADGLTGLSESMILFLILVRT